MSRLIVTDLHAEVAGREILHGVSFAVAPAEIHAFMGPNGAGKSTLAHAIMGRPGTTITKGTITLDGVDLTDLPAHARAKAGLFLGLQHPLEVPGVTLLDALVAASEESAETIDRRLRSGAASIGLNASLLERSLNVGLSGGERKRSEIVQLEVLRSPVALLDEIDSGLDVDALSAIGQHLSAAVADPQWQLSIVAITHFRRLLDVLTPDRIHVLVDGRLVDEGGPELVATLEAEGYARYREKSDDPFAL